MSQTALSIGVAALLVGQLFTVLSILLVLKTLKNHQDHLAIHDKMLEPLPDWTVHDASSMHN